MKVLSVLSVEGLHSYYDLDDAVADALDVSGDYDFETVRGYKVDINRDNVVYSVIGSGPYSSKVPPLDP